MRENSTNRVGISRVISFAAMLASTVAGRVISIQKCQSIVRSPITLFFIIGSRTKGREFHRDFFLFLARNARELVSKHADTDALALKFCSINVDKKKKNISRCENETLIFYFCNL